MFLSLPREPENCSVLLLLLETDFCPCSDCCCVDVQHSKELVVGRCLKFRLWIIEEPKRTNSYVSHIKPLKMAVVLVFK